MCTLQARGAFRNDNEIRRFVLAAISDTLFTSNTTDSPLKDPQHQITKTRVSWT